MASFFSKVAGYEATKKTFTVKMIMVMQCTTNLKNI